MTWKVIEFMHNNPEASPVQIVAHFAEEMEVDTQLKHLQQEVRKAMEIREELRPLYAKKMNLMSQLAVMDSDFEMQVMMKYPPRQGSDKERKAYKKELQEGHPDFQKSSAEADKLNVAIEELEQQMSDVHQEAKNARRIVETFNGYIQFVFRLSDKPKQYYDVEAQTNENIF